MRHCIIAALLFALPALAQDKPAAPPTSPVAEQWEKLLDTQKIDEAEKLCQSWVTSPDLTKQVEAQKCLANVSLSRGSIVSVNGNETGGGSIGEGYKPEAVTEALKHLNEGIRLDPQDISIHEGRLHVLEVAGIYDEMMKALEESIGLYEGPGTPDVWLAYAGELGGDGLPTPGLRLSEILYKHYPDNSDVIGNLGAFHNMLKQWDQGLPYVRKAVERSPTDPIDTWNLGWTLAHLGQNAEADKWMTQSLQLDPKSESSAERRCLYAKFVVTALKNSAKGCKLVRANCEADDRAECKRK